MSVRDNLYKRKLTDLMHMLFCDAAHAEDPRSLTDGETEDTCLYLVEETLVSAWEQRDHLRWLAVTEDFLSSTTFKSAEEAFLFWVELLDRNRQVEELLALQPSVRDWLRLLTH